MIHYVPICFILAILGTLLANPAFYYELIKKRRSYAAALREASRKGDESPDICKEYYSIFLTGQISIPLVLGQCILFIITFVASIFMLYFEQKTAVKFSSILAYLWIPAIAQFVNVSSWLGDSGSINSSFTCIDDTDDHIVTTGLLLMIIFFVIPISISIHKYAYNYFHPYDNITIMEENYAEYPTVDETNLLKVSNMITGSYLKSPIYRNGSWIYPVENSSSNVSSPGYLLVDSDGKKFTFVAKEIIYSPWSSTKTNTDVVARNFLPSAVFFGSTSFQVEPGTGDVYFCKFYGDYACLRAGRDVEGLVLINATTGECTRYSIKKMPAWVTGVSF